MIFKQAQQVLDGRKRQTRRPVKPGEHAVIQALAGTVKIWRPRWGPMHKDLMIVQVRDANGRLKWQVGKDYAAQPGRGVKAIGRTPPIEAIWRERLLRILPSDIIQEGIRLADNATIEDYLVAFAQLWNSLYHKPYRWRDDPEVWALEFEPVQGGA